METNIKIEGSLYINFLEKQNRILEDELAVFENEISKQQSMFNDSPQISQTQVNSFEEIVLRSKNSLKEKNKRNNMIIALLEASKVIC